MRTQQQQMPLAIGSHKSENYVIILNKPLEIHSGENIFISEVPLTIAQQDYSQSKFTHT